MRWLIRSLLFAYISVEVSQYIVGGFSFGENASSKILVILAVAALNMLVIPILKVVGLPHEGIGFLFMNFALTLITIYILPMFIGEFKIIEAELAQLRIFGFVLPSKHLTVNWSAVYSALVISMLYHSLEWLCEKR